MPLTRRYMFHGHAAALGGRIVRLGDTKDAKPVKDGFIDLPGSALTVVGGKSTAQLEGGQLKGPAATVVRFESATASSEGVFDDLKGHFAVTQGLREQSTLTATTSVRAEVRGLTVGLEDKIRMVVKGVRGGFTSKSGAAGGETPVQLDKDTGFDGNTVTFFNEQGKAFTLVVEVEADVFSRFDTSSGLAAAASEPAFLRKYGHTLFLSGLAAQKPAPTAPPVIRTDSGALQATIIKPLRWKGAEFPGSKIDPDQPNAVYVPGLGTLFFGELSAAKGSWRVTMVRGKLGSYAGGDFAAVDVMDNGGWT